MEQKRDKQSLSLESGRITNDELIERRFINSTDDAFAIYQLRHHKSTRDYRFQPIKQLQAAGLSVERKNYEAVYTHGLQDINAKTNPERLEEIYFRFNLDRPDDFDGHSLSVSDIVALKVNGVVTAHYVDRYGWQELHAFISDQQLRNAEILLEDDFSMIDGIINNGKREPDRERPSVVKQLRKQPTHTPKPPGKGKDGPAID